MTVPKSPQELSSEQLAYLKTLAGSPKFEIVTSLMILDRAGFVYSTPDCECADPGPTESGRWVAHGDDKLWVPFTAKE